MASPWCFSYFILYYAFFLFFNISIVTANIISTPLVISSTCVFNPNCTPALLINTIKIVPSTVPVTVPYPPASEAPPITAAAIAFISYPSPPVGKALCTRAASIIPAIPYKSPAPAYVA